MCLKSFLLIGLCCVNLGLTLDVGDRCDTKDPRVDGTCTVMSGCEAALQALRDRMFNEFNRCGFSGFEEIVCCPQTSNKFGTTIEPIVTQRLAETECNKIIQSRIPALDLHILGGELASLGEYPFIVAIGYDRGVGYVFDCGGSVLSPTYILTAAHCIDTLDRIEPTIIRAGVIEIGGSEWNNETDYRIAEILLHPNYSRREKYHDLALLRLEKQLQYTSNLNAVCLETRDEDPAMSLIIAGWGKTSNTRDTKSSLLLKANVTTTPRSKCGQSYTGWRKLPLGISPDQLCAGDPEGIRDTCQGDSGGPLISTTLDGQHTLVGVTSFGRGCGSPVPGVYTRVSRYLDWIESVVWSKRGRQ